MKLVLEYQFPAGLFMGWLISVLVSWIVSMIRDKPVAPVGEKSVWDRPEVITHTGLGPVLQLPVPAKKRFRTFLSLLKNAERADVDGDDVYRDHMLVYLIERIQESMKGKDAEE
jgi:hypothetical protein